VIFKYKQQIIFVIKKLQYCERVLVIISHKYKFIFIRVPKTASTSLQLALGKICGENDIVSPIKVDTPPEHVIRNSLGYGPHMSAKQITEKISNDIWKNYFKFCFERNPFDKIISYYWWRVKKKSYEGSFHEFCYDLLQGKIKFPPASELYSINGKIAVDYIGKYESLESDFDFICKKLKLPICEKLTKEKASYRESESHYNDYYDPETIKIVMNRYKNEIELFHYKFEKRV